MRKRILLGIVAMGLLGGGVLASSGDRPTSTFQSAIVTFAEPTNVAGVFISGTVLITHDDSMVLNEPCTSIFRLDPAKGPQEELVTFACIPAERERAESFILRTTPDPLLGCRRLTEFQFAGDTEAHGVPYRAE
jgi:hypothetical protein